MMELQTDIFDGKVKAENIKFPGSQAKETDAFKCGKWH